MIPVEHFTRDDVGGALIATVLFPAIVFIPGYVAAWATQVLDFRSQKAGTRFAISVPLSVGICPILAYWLDDLAGWTLVLISLAACWAAFVAILIHEARIRPFRWVRPSQESIATTLIAAFWVALAVASVVDLQFDHRLYASVTAADQSYRVALTDALSRSGFAHPRNPFYYIHAPAPLRYHYFWFILCSVADKLGGRFVLPRHAFVASIVWCGIALGCVTAAFLRFFAPEGVAKARRSSLMGVALLAATGLDIIPTVLLWNFHHIRYLDPEAWNEPVMAWFSSILWTPHHVGGLIAGLVAFLVLWHAAGLPRSRRTWVAAMVAGCALATMLGCSIYVGFVFAIFLVIWSVTTYVAKWRNHTWPLVFAGAIAVVLVIPYLKSLLGPASGGHFAEFTVRSFKGAKAFGLSAPGWDSYSGRLVLLPLNYFFELGLFFLVGILYIARVWSARLFKPQSVAAILMVTVSIGICTFLKSGVINNDLGWRGFMPAQFILLLWAVELFSSQETGGWLTQRLYPVLPLFVVIGLLTTGWTAIVLRFAPVLQDSNPPYPEGKRTYAARQVYEGLRKILPVQAIMQSNPEMENPVDWGLYSNRQAAAAQHDCGAAFGGDLQPCDGAYPAISAIFQDSGISSKEVEATCKKMSIDAVVVTSADPVWNSPGSWVWEKRPVISEDQARAFLMSPVGK